MPAIELAKIFLQSGRREKYASVNGQLVRVCLPVEVSLPVEALAKICLEYWC